MVERCFVQACHWLWLLYSCLLLAMAITLTMERSLEQHLVVHLFRLDLLWLDLLWLDLLWLGLLWLDLLWLDLLWLDLLWLDLLWPLHLYAARDQPLPAARGVAHVAARDALRGLPPHGAARAALRLAPAAPHGDDPTSPLPAPTIPIAGCTPS